MIDLKRLGLHNGSEFISSAFLIKDNRLVSIIALIDRLEARKIIPAHIKHGFNQIRASYKIWLHQSSPCCYTVQSLCERASRAF